MIPIYARDIREAGRVQGRYEGLAIAFRRTARWECNTGHEDAARMHDRMAAEYEDLAADMAQRAERLIQMCRDYWDHYRGVEPEQCEEPIKEAAE